MSKIIKLTPELIAQAEQDFKEAIKNLKAADGQINFTKTFKSGSDKATVYMTIMAYLKMTALINGFSSEVAWHGIADRIEGENNEYLISDILVYPQTVTGVNVDMDEDEYAEWIAKLNNESFDKLNFQGHSHVDMGVSPSRTDINSQKEILRQLGDESFYIFMICNKKMDVNCKVYDMAKNTMFERSDISLRILETGQDIVGLTSITSGFVSESRKLVKTKTYKAPAASAVTSVTIPVKTQSSNEPKVKTPAETQGKTRMEFKAIPEKSNSCSKPYSNAWSWEDEHDPFYASDGFNRYNYNRYY